MLCQKTSLRKFQSPLSLQLWLHLRRRSRGMRHALLSVTGQWPLHRKSLCVLSLRQEFRPNSSQWVTKVPRTMNKNATQTRIAQSVCDQTTKQRASAS